MPLTVRARKAALVARGLTMQQIGEETGTDRYYVSHVIAGRYRSSPKAKKVMRRVARAIGVPVSEVFPDDQGTGESVSLSA